MSSRSRAGVAPLVSVIIPHYHDPVGLNVCLESIGRQTYPRDRLEVIVADNNSPEGLDVIEKVIDGRARLVSVLEKGAGPARNGAVAVADGDILAFIDADCVAEPGWIAGGVPGLVNYDFVGGKVQVLVDDMDRMTPAEAFERVFAFDFETYITKNGFTGSGNLFCSRKVFDAVGDFRRGVSEDIEWSNRARARGFRLGYVPEAVVGHPARRTWPELLDKWRKTHSETYELAKSQPRGRLRWFLRIVALPASALVHTPRVLRSGELHTPGQRMAAISTLYRIRGWRFVDGLRRLMG